MSCGESDKFKNAFFHNILMRDLEVYRLVRVSVRRILTKFVKMKGTEGLLMLTKFGIAVLIFGDIQPPEYV